MRPLDRPRPRVARPLGRPAQAVAAARRPASGCCATTAGATAARRRTAGRSASTSRSPTSSRCSTADRRSCSATATAATSRSALADRHPELVRAVGVYETPLPWLDWWPTTTAGGAGGGQRRRPGGRRRAVHAPDGRRREVGAPAGADAGGAAGRGRDDGGRARRPAAGARRGTRRGSTCRPWRCAGPTAPSTTSVRRRTSGEVLADCPVVTIEGARHFGPNTHPDAVAAVVTELVSRAASRR